MVINYNQHINTYGDGARKTNPKQNVFPVSFETTCIFKISYYTLR